MSDTITPRLRIKSQPQNKVRLRVMPALLPMEIELRSTGTVVQWRYVGQDWQDLIPIDDIDASVTIGAVSTLAPGVAATVVNVGTAQNAVLNFGIPAGYDGLVTDIVAGQGVSVDATNPAHPVVAVDAIASEIPFSPAGSLAATDVQSAIEELDTEKATAAQGALADTSVQTLVEGTGIDIDATDPAHPVVSINDTRVTNALQQGRQSLYVPASAMYPRATSGAAEITYDSGSNDITIRALGFDTTTQEYAQFEIVMPKSWDRGTVSFAPYWTNTGGASTQTVRWTLAGVAISNDDTLNATLGTAQNSDDTWIAQNDLHVGPESSAITIGGSPAEGDVIVFQVSRGVANDNMAGDAVLLGIMLFFSIDKVNDA